MKRILTLIRRDLLSTSKDFLMLYIALAPLLLAFGARLFMPTLGDSALNLVVTREADAALVQRLELFAKVDVVESRADLERRVLAYDDAVGLIPAGGGGGYTVVTEGNESHEAEVLAAMVLQRALAGGDAMPVAMEALSTERFPYREVFGAFAALSAPFLTGIVMGLWIVEDKESRMLQALGVSPLGRREYLAARGLLTALVGLALNVGSLWVLGLTQFDYLQVLAIGLATAITGALMGFLIGALSANQISGIANIKFGMMLVIAPPIAALLVPESYKPLLWWLSPYWSFTSFRAVLETGIAWGDLVPQLTWNLLATLGLAAVCVPLLKGRLNFGRD